MPPTYLKTPDDPSFRFSFQGRSLRAGSLILPFVTPLFVGGMVILATDAGLTMSPSTNAIQGLMPVSRAWIGSAMNNATRQVGGALGVAVLGSLMNTTYLDKIENVRAFASVAGKIAEAIRGSIQGAHIVAEQCCRKIYRNPLSMDRTRHLSQG